MYTLVKNIGKGGFGIVDEVVDANGKPFARKTFQPAGIPEKFHDKLRKRFKREVLTQEELGGEVIISVLDHDLSGEQPWFIMPLADKTFTKYVEESKKSGDIEIDPLADIINGLQHLHDEGYVHRDLNPNNILLHDGKWKLSDLGAILPPTGGTVTLTKDTVIFTEKYCSPEQRKDFHNAQASADIYSFGCILHDVFGIYERIPYAKHNAPGGIGIIIEKCTDQNPSKRPSIKTLRGLVIDTLFEEGGHCKVEDKESSDWLDKLDSLDEWSVEEFDNFAHFFGNLNTSEKTDEHEGDWVYSLSTPFLTRIPNETLKSLVERKDGVSTAVVEKYCEWANNTRFRFNFADSVCNRLTTIFEHGTKSDKATAFASLVKLGGSHNRWYVMRCVTNRCRSGNIESGLAKRLAIEIKTEELTYMLKQCFDTINVDISVAADDIKKLF